MVPPAKTYLMVPNFDFPEDSSIQLGNLLADPFTPHRPLTALAPDKWPAITKSVQKKRAIVRETGDDANFSAWLQALKIVGAKVGAEYGKTTRDKYNMDALNTSFFKVDPSDEDIKVLLKDPKVQGAMRTTFWSRPVYMISGLKVAEEFSVSSEANTHQGVSGGVSAAVTPQVSVGIDAGGSNDRGKKDSFEAGQNTVVAYQLLQISRKGQMKEYHPQPAFLGNGDEKPKPSTEVETGIVTAEDLREIDEDVVLEEVLVDEGNVSVYIASIE